MSPFAPVRVAANGRHEMRCVTCRNYYWLTALEQATWTTCPHCVGWWTFTSEAA